MNARRRLAGFTLIELMVALFVLALVAVLSWRGLDGMVRAQETTQARADEIHALQIGLAQWNADLDALVQLPQMPGLDWNGRVLRLTRPASTAAGDGLIVVGWSRRAQGGLPVWMRWQSPPLITRGQVEDAWNRADAWAQGQGGTEDASAVAVTALQDWQVFYFRSDAWTNPLSSDATQATATPAPNPSVPTPQNPASAPTPAATPTPQQANPRAPVIPDGIRIILTLAGGQAITGDLVIDWVRPTVSGSKS